MTNPPRQLTINGNLILRRENSENWKLIGPTISIPLDNEADFQRVISLLETPFAEVNSALGKDFPYKIIISLGLKHDSDYWIERALNWIKDIPNKNAYDFTEELISISNEKKISQKNRQIAKKELKRYLAAGDQLNS